MSRQKWQNWSGMVVCEPSEILYPKSEEEVVAIVQRAAETKTIVRIAGKGHSFSHLVYSNDIIVSLDKLSGLISVDKEKNEATVWAGTAIKTLGELLFEKGLAQENLGDIDVQSIAGAISTGTHGTGMAFGNIATQVTAMTIVTGTGEILNLSATENPDLFRAAQVSLGVLGVITKLTIKCLRAYNLEIKLAKSTFTETMNGLEGLNNNNRNFEFYCFPFSEIVQHRITNITNKPPKKNAIARYFNDVVMENGIFWLLSEYSRMFPSKSHSISRLIASAASNTVKTDHSHRVFATVRNVRFNEMEYNVPLEDYKMVIKDLKKRIDERKYQVHFPIENRFVKGDDIWLSPAYERASAYIAIHMYKGMEYKRYFREMEEIFMAYGGRPHWGKMHYQTAESLATRYPKWEAFHTLRKGLDPQGIFLNDYLKRMFGEKTYLNNRED